MSAVHFRKSETDTALIKKGSNRGLLYDYDTGNSGDTLITLTPQEDGEKYLDFITEGEILSQTDTVIVKVFTNDENIDTTEAVVIIYPNEIVCADNSICNISGRYSKGCLKEKRSKRFRRICIR